MHRFEDISDEDLLKVESVCAEFETEFRSSGRSSIEKTLTSVPRPLQACLFRELLATEIEFCHLAGSVTPLQEYLDRFPERKSDVDRIYWETVQEISKQEIPVDENSADDVAGPVALMESRSKDPGAEKDPDDNAFATARAPHDVIPSDAAAGNDLVKDGNDDTLILSDSTVAIGDVLSDAQFVPVYGSEKRYQVESEIDRGGMGVVLKVKDIHLNRTLAMKVVRGLDGAGSSAGAEPSKDRLARFVREASITSRLDHPGVVPVHEMARDDHGRLFFTMKMVQGKTLSQVAREMRAGKSTTWTRARILEVLVRICDTLAFAHSHGVIHRDLKPSNIMVGDYGEAYVMDWGLAKVIRPENTEGQRPSPFTTSDKNEDDLTVRDPFTADGSLQSLGDAAGQTMDGSIMGTPHYMSPEQASGKSQELDERADIYSLGALLYEILTGQKPYAEHKTPVDVVLAVCSAPPVSIEEMDRKAPSELVAIAEKAMQREKGDRYQNVTEMAQDIRAFLDNRVVAAYKTGAWAEFEKWMVRNRSIVATTVLLGFIGLAMIAYFQFDKYSLVSENNATLKGLNSKLESTNGKLESTNETLQQKNIDLDLAVRNLKGKNLIQSANKLLDSQGDSTLAAILTTQALRDYEYDLPESRSTLFSVASQLAEQHVCNGHVGTIGQVKFSPDGQRLATASYDGTCIIWDTLTGESKTLLVNRQNDFVRSIDFSSDGSRLLLGGQDGSVGIWNSQTGRREFHTQVGTTTATNGRPPAVFNVFFLPSAERSDEERILVCSLDGSIYVIAPAKDKIEFEWKQKGETRLKVTDMQLSPDHEKIALGFSNGSTSLIQIQADQFQSIFSSPPLGNNLDVESISFSKDSKLLVSTIQDDSISSQYPATVWHTATGKIAHEIKLGTGIVAAQFCSENGSVALSVIDNGKYNLVLYDPHLSRTVAESEQMDHSIRLIKCSPDGSRIATLSGVSDLHVWDVFTNHDSKTYIQLQETLRGHAADKKIIDITFDPSGERLASGSRDRSARIWALDKNRAVPVIGKAAWLEGTIPDYFVRWSPDGTRLLLLDKDKKAGSLWSYAEQQLQKISRIEFNPNGTPYSWNQLSHWNFSRDGKTIFAALDSSKKLLAWDGKDGQFQYTIDNIGQGPYKDIISNARENLVCVISKDQTSLFDVTTGEPVYQFRQPAENHVFVSRDLEFVITYQEDSIWRRDVATGETIKFDFPTKVPVALSPDGKYLICKGEIIDESNDRLESYDFHVLNTQSGKLVFTVSDDTSPARVPKEVLFSRDNRWLFVKYFKHPTRNSKNDAYSVWSVADRKKVSSFGHDFSATLGYSDDYSRFLIGSQFGIQLFDGHQGRVIATIQPTFGRVRSAKFSLDGRHFIVHETGDQNVGPGSEIKVAQSSLWQADTGKVVGYLPRDGNHYVCGFAPDNESFLTFDAHSSVQHWQLDLLSAVEDAIARRMTNAEKNLYSVDGHSSQVGSESDLTAKLDSWARRIGQLGKVTSEKRNEAWRLVDSAQQWLKLEPGSKQIEMIKTSLHSLHDPWLGTDPVLLSKMATLFAGLGDEKKAVVLMEEALDHPRADVQSEALIELRKKLLPEIVSFASAEWLAKTEELSAEQINQAESWMRENNAELLAYYTAVQSSALGEYAEAAGQLDSARFRQTRDPRPLSLLIQCWSKMNETEKAIRQLTAAFEVPEFQNRFLVGEWLRLNLQQQDTNFQELTRSLPAPSQRWIDQNHLDDAKWLLQQLSTNEPLRINCGSYANKVVDGTPWSKDRFFLSGFGFWESEGEARVFAGQIANTKLPFLFQTERWFDNKQAPKRLGYEIPLPPGNYEVTLGFAEIYEEKRDFDVEVEGIKVVENYDPANNQFATAEKVSKKVSTEDGMLNILFQSHNSENAKIASIEIKRIN